MPAITPVLFPERFFLLSVFSDHSPLSYFLAVNRGSFAAIDFLCHLPSGDLLYLYSTGNRSLRERETIEILTHAGYYAGDLNPKVLVYFLCVFFSIAIKEFEIPLTFWFFLMYTSYTGITITILITGDQRTVTLDIVLCSKR